MLNTAVTRRRLPPGPPAGASEQPRKRRRLALPPLTRGVAPRQPRFEHEQLQVAARQPGRCGSLHFLLGELVDLADRRSGWVNARFVCTFP
eukprot:g37279.t1